MKKGLFLFAILIVALFSMEVLLRANNFTYNVPFYEEDIPFIHKKINIDLRMYQFDFKLFWKFRPNNSDYDVNAAGFRDKDYAAYQKKGFRIIAMGDSCTAGHSLPLEGTYCAQLEEKLNNDLLNGSYEVINAGVPGYTSFQGKRYLKKILKYDPDFLIVFYGCNDRAKARFEDKKLNYWRLFAIQFQRGFLAKTRFYQYVISKTNYFKDISWNIRVDEADYVDNLNFIKNKCVKKGIAVLFIKHCRRNEIESSVKYNRYTPPDPYIDLFGLFKSFKGNEEEIYLDQIHYALLGNEIIANEVYEWMNKKGLLGKRPEIRGHN